MHVINSTTYGDPCQMLAFDLFHFCEIKSYNILQVEYFCAWASLMLKRIVCTKTVNVQKAILGFISVRNVLNYVEPNLWS